jgi:hypothetical protein
MQICATVLPAYFAPASSASLTLFCFFQAFESLSHMLSHEHMFANEDYSALAFNSREYIDNWENQDSRHKAT